MKVICSFLLVVAAAISAAAEESYLFWMYNNSDIDKYYTEFQTGGGAKVAVYQGAAHLGYLNLSGYDAEGGEVSLGTLADSKSVYSNGGDTQFGFWANLGSYVGSDYSYVVELWADGASKATESSIALKYASAISSKFITLGGIGEPAGGAWAAAFNIPEPTSGLLVLVGGALLALRRRRRIAA